MRTSIIIIVLAAVGVYQSHAACRVCNANGVACVSRNEYQFCFEGIPNTRETFSCPKDSQVCTKFGIICVDTELAASVAAECDEADVCGVCKGVADGAFTCTSRKTFTMCADESLTKQRGSCPEGYLCDPKSTARPCVISGMVKEANICDVDTPIDEPVPQISTTTIPTKSSTMVPTPITKKPPAVVCSSAGRFPKADDTDCSGYIYCYWNSGSLLSTQLPCPERRYFNKRNTVCDATKPSWCS